jgi:hypothetical protein
MLNLISPTIIENFDYWNYLQRAIGWSHFAPPVVPKRPPDNGYLHNIGIQVDYLMALHEEYRRLRGEGFEQQPLFPKSS